MLHVQIIMQGNTATLPSLRPGDPPASLTDHRETGPVTLLLVCHPDAYGASVGVITGGIAHENGHLRLITAAPTQIAFEHGLAPGETYERPLQTSHGPATLRLRHEVSA